MGWLGLIIEILKNERLRQFLTKNFRFIIVLSLIGTSSYLINRRINNLTIRYLQIKISISAKTNQSIF